MNKIKIVIFVIAALAVVAWVYFNKLIIVNNSSQNYKNLVLYAGEKEIWSGDLDINNIRFVIFSVENNAKYKLTSTDGLPFTTEKDGYVSPGYKGIDKLTVFNFSELRWE